MDAVFLLDVSGGMSQNASVIRYAVRRAVSRMSAGVRVALVCYSDVCEGGGDGPVRMATDFTDDPSVFRAALGEVCHGAGGGAEAQHLAMARLLSPSFLSWRSPRHARAAVFHFTDASPNRTREERSAVMLEMGENSDWVSIGRAFGRAGVRVHVFLFTSDNFAAAAPWHAVLAALTGAGGVVAAGRDKHGLGKHLSALLDGATPLECSFIRLSHGSLERLLQTPDERNAGDLLTNTRGLRVDGPDKNSRIILAQSFRGLVRHDADNSRCPINPSVYEEALRKAHGDLIRDVRSALQRHGEGGEVCDVVTSLSYREMCTEFCERGAQPSLADLFESVAGIVAGPAICAPFTSSTGRFNYQTAFGLRVRAVRCGYRMSYASFMNYWRSKRTDGMEVSRRGELRRGVEDLVLRKEGDITGVLPVIAEDSGLARDVYRSLARTPWLDAVAWHSVCRHVFPPPRACLGLVASAAWASCGDDGVPDRFLRLFAESAAELGPVRIRDGCDVSKHAAAAARGIRDWPALVRAAVRQRCRRFRKCARGRVGFVSDTHEGRYYPPASHRVAVSDVARSIRRLATAVGETPPEDLENAALAALLEELFGAPSYPAAAEKHGPALESNEPLCPAPQPAPEPKGNRTFLPKTGTPKFNRSLTVAAESARKARGLPMAGRPDERMRLSPDDIDDGDVGAGGGLIRKRGSAEFLYVDGRWMPVRLGDIVRTEENRSGRRVFVWPD